MELLKRLNDSFSVSGYENEIRAEVCAYLKQWYDVSIDKMGNVIASKGPSTKQISFLAPMDTGGYFLNLEKEKDSYYCVKISSESKPLTDDAAGRTLDGTRGTFFTAENDSFFVTEGKTLSLPTVADVLVPASESEHRITAKHAALYTLLRLAERLSGYDRAVSFVALAQTKHRQRGVCGTLPQSDISVLIESMEKESLGQGALWCLKDGTYLCPAKIKMCFSEFCNRLVCEEKPSLAFALSKQKGVGEVASFKIPVRNIGTANETFCLSDVVGLCDVFSNLVEKGLTKR